MSVWLERYFECMNCMGSRSILLHTTIRVSISESRDDAMSYKESVNR